ncbi:MAG TPA: DNA-3-methyladenine glycosylase [Candidatus Saccharimonadales bacterium]|nr:DNA-3-methyladenine glycosylase [Candidatus Saccharimonadales bacterium]
MKFSDPIMNSLIEKYPAPTFSDRTTSLFEDLIESVISQQLSVKASNTIYKRFKALFIPHQGVTEAGDHQNSSSTNTVSDASLAGSDRLDTSFPTPQEILDMPDETMRTAGISFQKISYIKSIADAFLSNLIDIEKIKNMSDEEIIAHLTQIRGIGKWTAEMTLIFTLNRPDVFSLGDLGIRNAIKNLYALTDKEKILQLSEKWKPYRSTACWYFWRSLENS